MLDKLAGWRGEIRPQQVEFMDEARPRLLQASGRGALILGSHLGDLELCRALGTAMGQVTINALVFTEHAVKQMHAFAQHGRFDTEAGGVLLGRHLLESRDVVVDEVVAHLTCARAHLGGAVVAVAR